MSKDKGKRKGILPLMNEAWLDRLEEMKAVNDAQMKEVASKPSDAGSEIYMKVLSKHGKAIDKQLEKLREKVKASRAAESSQSDKG